MKKKAISIITLIALGLFAIMALRPSKIIKVEFKANNSIIKIDCDKAFFVNGKTTLMLTNESVRQLNAKIEGNFVSKETPYDISIGGVSCGSVMLDKINGPISRGITVSTPTIDMKALKAIGVSFPEVSAPTR